MSTSGSALAEGRLEPLEEDPVFLQSLALLRLAALAKALINALEARFDAEHIGQDELTVKRFQVALGIDGAQDMRVRGHFRRRGPRGRRHPLALFCCAARR